MVRRIGLALVIAAGACTFPEQPLPPGERQVVVHAILDPSQRYQLVNLSMTDGTVQGPDDVFGADVRITTPDGTELTARQDTIRDQNGKFVYTRPLYRIDLQTLGVALQPGGTYQLRVQTAAGDVITGETTIPTADPAPLPAPVSFVRQRDTLRLSWPPVAGARTYEAQVWTVQSNYYFARLEYTAFFDSTLTLAGTAKTWNDNDVFPANQSATVRVTVYAVDDNYYQYYRLLGDPYIGAAPSRLQGGVGVFGAVVPVAQRQLTIK